MADERFTGDFSDMSEDGVREKLCSEFDITRDVVDAYDIESATMGSYSGYDSRCSIVLRERATGQLFIVEASHCSCYGYSGQWEPALVTDAYLAMREQ